MADILRKTAGGSAGGSAGGFQVPIVSLSHVVPNSEFSQLISQLDESDPALQRLYEAIPASLPRTKASLLKVVSSPFFYRASETLSEALRNAELEGGAPVGRFLANDLGFPYQKEGIEGFVNGIRVQGLKEAQGTQEGQQISKNAIEEDKPSEMDEDEDSDTVDMV